MVLCDVYRKHNVFSAVHECFGEEDAIFVLEEWQPRLRRVEMVLAHARGFRAGKCQLLIMWCLKTPLELLVAFLKESIVEACWYFHQQWGLADPCNGYCLTYDLSVDFDTALSIQDRAECSW